MRLVVDVKVSDLTRAVAFYSGILELPVRMKTDVSAAMGVSDADIHLYTDGGVTEGVEFYVDDLDAEVHKLSEKGVKFVSGMDKPDAKNFEKGITEFPWGRMAYFKDSEGNELALIKDF